ncbi:hypothetical protein Vafri_1526 [Volvox africanus]|nr:hypothetical protein Vafri_1526 [Volvox africanus]
MFELKRNILTGSRAVLVRPVGRVSHAQSCLLRRGHFRFTPAARMHVPSDSFSGQSPERKAATALRSLFTFVAARVVLEQLQGPAGPTLTGHTSYNQQAYLDLMDFLGVPMKGDGGDEWLANVMRKNHALALRLMEVREAYLDEFEWQQVAEMAGRETREANTRLMRAAAMASLQASLGGPVGNGSVQMSGDDLDGPPSAQPKSV